MANTYFVDTNILLHSSLDELFNTEDKICISSITMYELDNIKESSRKDEDVKYRARIASRYLNEHPENYELVLFKEKYWRKIRKHGFEDKPDSRIIATAFAYSKNLFSKKPNYYFITQDRNCGLMAKTVGLNVRFQTTDEKEPYLGYLEYNFTDEELGEFYGSWLQENLNPLGLVENEYLIVNNSKGTTVDKYKWRGNQYNKIPFPKFNSAMFGKITPKDEYQACAMDSFINNQLTVIGGPAGSGKSYLALGYLFQALEKNEIDKIIIFCNPVAAKGAAKLGFLPGTRDEKLLSSQVGGVLASKLGSIETVIDLIDKDKLALLPIADARGYQVPPYSAVYMLEAQNMDIELLKLALQRTSEDTKIIIDGDHINAQTDMGIYAGDSNGMRRAIEIFAGKDCYGQVMLKNIYRSKIGEIADKM